VLLLLLLLPSLQSPDAALDYYNGCCCSRLLWQHLLQGLLLQGLLLLLQPPLSA
jgi:hypothetical protein